MSVYRYCAPVCDLCFEEPTAFPSVGEVRRWMRQNGWVHASQYDVCPRCVASWPELLAGVGGYRVTEDVPGTLRAWLDRRSGVGG